MLMSKEREAEKALPECGVHDLCGLAPPLPPARVGGEAGCSRV